MINYVPNSFKAPYKPIPIKIERSVYCEMSFLKKIQPILETPLTILDMDERDLRFKMLVDMLINFNLYVDIPENDIPRDTKLYDSSNNILQKIARKKFSGTGTRIKGNQHFVSIHQISEHSTPEQLNSIYLTCEPDELCRQISKKYGVMIIRYDEKEDDVTPKYLLKNAIMNKHIIKGRKVDGDRWGFLQELHAVSNSLVVIDGYILSRKDKIDYNLRSILNKILPKESLSIPYNITILANEKTETNEFELCLSEAKVNVTNIIREIRPGEFNFTLNVWSMMGKEHDRWIITNNLYLSCPSGFDLIYCDKRNNSWYNKSSVVHASYIYSNKEDKRDYEQLCQRLISLKKDENILWMDDKINRLL